MTLQDAKKRLETLVPQFKTHKTDADALSKIVKAENEEIKKLMTAYELPEFSSEDGTRVTCSVSCRENFDEEALLAKIKSLKLPKECKVIRRKEYVDMEALESAIYHGLIPAAELASCQTRTEIVTLRIAGGKK